jgi:fructose/tagatose bisphosphate aldolase
MPIATLEQYRQMLDAAQKGGYAYPAINIASLTTANGALKAFSEAHSDGIIQLSSGGGSLPPVSQSMMRPMDIALDGHRTTLKIFNLFARPEANPE